MAASVYCHGSYFNYMCPFDIRAREPFLIPCLNSQERPTSPHSLPTAFSPEHLKPVYLKSGRLVVLPEAIDLIPLYFVNNVPTHNQQVGEFPCPETEISIG
jgi:hypothetical protein